MALATLTNKGQVTIPKEVRDTLRLQTGDKVEFIVHESGGAIFRSVTKKADEVFGRLHKPKRKSVSVKEMDAEIRKMMRVNSR